MLPLFLAAFLVSSVAAADCTYSGGDVSARWQVSGDKLTVEFINKKIGNNQWTGIGFGPNMENLEVVLVKIEGSKPVLVTGHTSGYDAPTLDKSANVSPQLMNYNSNQLTFRFTRPLGANGARNHKLDECQTWNDRSMLTLFPKMFIESTKLFGFYSVPSVMYTTAIRT
ncbi:hypothetical protein Y032_0181g863 [Ancylostoma ceylanicum]|uniref:DOMON domain-containing protein n=1 Tax=Ancylostoma ceylanicum TaxID=53326 RepID=A0A016SS89_9BILA|nr:hypothetical protein Y032_0181g863 [Ancylostoma ceylanicum]